jgi:nicotinate-nucleotide adenylyltransferase
MMKELSGACRVAVIGGTFDPIHNGHLAAAEMARDWLSIDKVVFIPSGKPPHKDAGLVSDKEDRLAMTMLATASNPSFSVSRMELDRPGESYTVDTLREIQKFCSKKAKTYFITGADSLCEMRSWKSAEQIFEIASIACVTRAGFDKGLMEEIASLKEEYGAKIHLVRIPDIGISSTDIRRRIQAGIPVRYLVPDAVEAYIKKRGIYRIQWDGVDEAEKAVRKALSPKRWKHTQGVVQLALTLAKRFGADQKKAHCAALLHDIAKEVTSEEKIKLCRMYGVPLDEISVLQPDLLHCALGAEIAKRELGIKDKEVLNAIRYHNTGRKGMTLLDKIIIVADSAEPYRQDYEELAQIRKAAETDLDLAARLTLESKIDFTKSKGKLVHPMGVEALEDLAASQNALEPCPCRS